MKIKVTKNTESEINPSIFVEDYGEYITNEYSIKINEKLYTFRTNNRGLKPIKNFISDTIIQQNMIDELGIPEEEFICTDFEQPFDVRVNPSDDHVINTILKVVIERHIELDIGDGDGVLS